MYVGYRLTKISSSQALCLQRGEIFSLRKKAYLFISLSQIFDFKGQCSGIKETFFNQIFLDRFLVSLKKLNFNF